MLDIADVDLNGDRREVFARAFGSSQDVAPRAHSREISDASRDRTGTSAGDRVLTRAEEEVRVRTREVSRGDARITKHVTTEHVSQPVTRHHEEVVVERRPVQAGTSSDASLSEDEIRIPLKAEEVVVEKRPVVKEELVVGKRLVEDRDEVETEVRKEEINIENPVATGSHTKGNR